MLTLGSFIPEPTVLLFVEAKRAEDILAIKIFLGFAQA